MNEWMDIRVDLRMEPGLDHTQDNMCWGFDKLKYAEGYILGGGISEMCSMQ